MFQFTTSENSRVYAFCSTSSFVLFLFPFVFGCTVPASAKEPDAKPIAPSALKLTWPKNENAEKGYRIERKTDDQWEQLAIVGSDRTSYESVGLSTEQPVLHRIRPLGTNDQAWTTFPAVKTPPAPEKLKADLLLEGTKQFPRNSEGDLIELKSGKLLYLFGRWPGAGDATKGTRIGYVSSTDGGNSWSEPETLFREKGYDLYHASLTRLENGDVGLSYTKRKQAKHHHQTGEKMFRYSTDGADSWSDEIQISNGDWSYYQTSRNDVLERLDSGRLVHPLSRLMTPGKGAEGGIGTLVYYSDDNGRSWKRATSKALREPKKDVLHEADIVEYEPGKLLMLARTHTGWLYEARSNDGGETWTDPEQSWIPSAVAPPQLMAVPDRDTVMLVWNPYVGEGNRLGPRYVLGAWFSRNGGRTWSGYREIEHHSVPDPSRNYAGYCYASGAWIGETLHLTYMDMHGSKEGRVRTRYRRIPLEQLIP